MQILRDADDANTAVLLFDWDRAHRRQPAWGWRLLTSSRDEVRDLIDHAERGQSAPLRAALSDRGASFERRQFAVGTLGRMRAEEAIPDLIGTLAGDGDPRLRMEAATALAWFKSPIVRDALLDALDDKDDGVACQATRGLRRTPDPEIVERLAELVLKGAAAARDLRGQRIVRNRR